jgi:hypothetical protein
MSFLAKSIKEIISVAGDGNAVDIFSKISKFKNQLEDILKILQESNDLRVHDLENGGALRGPLKSRRKYELHQKSNHKLCCHERYMKYGHNDAPSEVPYMRSLFNGRVMDGYEIIAYEMPLMRKKTKNKNRDINGREISCDLLGLKGNELCCIEVKIIPYNNATNLPYALLEGFAYAACLKWLLKNHTDEINNEVNFCCKSFERADPTQSIEKATFAIAAPESDYFMPYAIKEIKDLSKKRLSKEWFRRRIKEINIIEKAITEKFKDWFAGYMVLSQSADDCDSLKIDDEKVEPFFVNKNNIANYSTIEKLLAALS